jgi:uncharacterized protein YkwD
MKASNQLAVAGLLAVIGAISMVTFASFATSNHSVAKSSTPAGKIVLMPLTSSATIRDSEIAEDVQTESSTIETVTLAVAELPSTPHPKAAPKITAQAKVIVAPAPKPATVTAPSCTAGAFVNQFLCLLNEYRASKKLGKLSGNSALSNVALGHSEWMNSTETFSHTGINGTRLGDRCKAAGITCRAENLAFKAGSAQNLLDMWKASPSHNANLLGGYSTAGLGISGSYITLLMN